MYLPCLLFSEPIFHVCCNIFGNTLEVCGQHGPTMPLKFLYGARVHLKVDVNREQISTGLQLPGPESGLLSMSYVR
jgi:hypothetical protein